MSENTEGRVGWFEDINKLNVVTFVLSIQSNVVPFAQFYQCELSLLEKSIVFFSSYPLIKPGVQECLHLHHYTIFITWNK